MIRSAVHLDGWAAALTSARILKETAVQRSAEGSRGTLWDANTLVWVIVLLAFALISN